jgi:hypothetical protein
MRQLGKFRHPSAVIKTKSSLTSNAGKGRR